MNVLLECEMVGAAFVKPHEERSPSAVQSSCLSVLHQYEDQYKQRDPFLSTGY